jgi:hypothetical protein
LRAPDRVTTFRQSSHPLPKSNVQQGAPTPNQLISKTKLELLTAGPAGKFGAALSAGKQYGLDSPAQSTSNIREECSR